jgi:hypothetical protein
LKAVLGRPLTLMEQASEMVDEVPDPRLKRPKEVYEHHALMSALTGIAPTRTDPRINRLNQEAGLDRQIRAAEAAARRWRQRGRPDLAESSMEAAAKLEGERRKLMMR